MSTPTMTILVYSDDYTTRQKVRLAIGRRPAPDLPRVEYMECATAPMVRRALDEGGIDVLVLDGEAVPYGGLGLSRQLKSEVYKCPPVLVIIGRAQDAWLASWSLAESVAAHPIQPVQVANAVADLMRRRAAQLPAAS